MEPISTVIAALAWAKPYLIAAGAKKIAEGSLDGSLVAGKKVWDWLRQKLANSSAAAALSQVDDEPNNELNWEILAPSIAKALQENPGLGQELIEILRELGSVQPCQQVVQSGNFNKNAQVTGLSNTVSQ